MVGPKDRSPVVVHSLYEAFSDASNEPATLELLAGYIQVHRKLNPAQYRASAENYFNSVTPRLIKAGLAKG